MIFWQLFLSYLKIGFFGFGGGYAMLSLIQNEVVVRHGWMTGAEFADIVAVSQITPGPIAINSATYVGYTSAGVPGAVVASLGLVAPSLMVISTSPFCSWTDTDWMVLSSTWEISPEDSRVRPEI